MKYRCVANSPEAVVQLIAASYLRHGYYWYVTGRIPSTKKPEIIDRKLIEKYDIDISEGQRTRRRKQELANAHYLRYHYWFIILLSEGHHQLRQPVSRGGEAEHIKDCRRMPIKFAGYSISYRKRGAAPKGGGLATWHAHVRIDKTPYLTLKAYFESIAVHRNVSHLSAEFAAIQFARYAPIRRQLLSILRRVNKLRQQHSYEPIPYTALKLSRYSVKIYENATNEANQVNQSPNAATGDNPLSVGLGTLGNRQIDKAA